MGTTILHHHECDGCGAEERHQFTYPPGADMPVPWTNGWDRIRGFLFCEECLGVATKGWTDALRAHEPATKFAPPSP